MHPVVATGDDEEREPGLQADVEHLLVARLCVSVEDEGDAIDLRRFQELRQVVRVADHRHPEHRVVQLPGLHGFRARRLHELLHGGV
ncbi:MAG: hypothetical protein E6I05_03310 [Chloroflexi bacterium]|nr:MAG: hypothetical protein E6I05_03310 [Chloroflexota bacterium]